MLIFPNVFLDIHSSHSLLAKYRLTMALLPPPSSPPPPLPSPLPLPIAESHSLLSPHFPLRIPSPLPHFFSEDYLLPHSHSKVFLFPHFLSKHSLRFSSPKGFLPNFLPSLEEFLTSLLISFTTSSTSLLGSPSQFPHFYCIRISSRLS